jgi:hypothetical protein
MKNGLLEKFGTRVNFLFANNEELKAVESKMREDSLL